MGVFEIIWAVLVSLASIALIFVVLMQSGKEEGLSGVFGGNSDSYMSKNKKQTVDQLLATSTKWIALAWIVLVLVMSLI